ncbi:MAG: polyprenyl synthetase family protein [Candidatus Bathyarchaeia archaeon]
MVKKLGKIIVADLEKRSKKGLEFAKQIMQTERMEHPILREALEHYLTHWKDFTHPGLFSMACEAVGGNIDDAVSAQAAIAMMAAAFDIHDDIIDRSKAKHKIPTVYGKFGAEIALLLGNAFLIEGFKLFVDSTMLLPKEKGKEALDTLKRLMFEVGNGHAIEVGLKGRKKVAPDDYMKVIGMKAAGIELDMHFGALFGGGKDAEVEQLARLGRILGILVLLREEFIDVFEIEELRQRIVVHDLPVPLLFAMQDPEAKGKVNTVISKPKISQNDVNELVECTLEATPVVKLKKKMQALIEEGSKFAKCLPNPKLRSQLQTFLSFMLEDL